MRTVSATLLQKSEPAETRPKKTEPATAATLELQQVGAIENGVRGSMSLVV